MSSSRGTPMGTPNGPRVPLSRPRWRQHCEQPAPASGPARDGPHLIPGLVRQLPYPHASGGISGASAGTSTPSSRSTCQTIGDVPHRTYEDLCRPSSGPRASPGKWRRGTGTTWKKKKKMGGTPSPSAVPKRGDRSSAWCVPCPPAHSTFRSPDHTDIVRRRRNDGNRMSVMQGWIWASVMRAGVDLFIHQQGIDTSTRAGKLFFSIVGAFGPV